MTWNWKYILIGGALFVLFLAMGKNPVQSPDVGGTPQDRFAKQLSERSSKPGGSLWGSSVLPQSPSGPGGATFTPPATGNSPALSFKSTQPDWSALKSTLQPPPAAVTSTLPGQENAPAFYLRSGQRIYFAGTKVYTMGADGQLTPLPDGQYTLQSGHTVVVQGGIRQASQ